MAVRVNGIGFECEWCGTDNLPEAWKPWAYRCGCVECADRRDRNAEEVKLQEGDRT
jgi:hypothetical protein